MTRSLDEEEYEVEKIVGHKIVKKNKRNEIRYRIKWTGYDEKDNTWERESNVFATKLIIDYWTRIPKNSPDRQLFEKKQSKKKDPIKLPEENQSKKIDTLFKKETKPVFTPVASSSKAPLLPSTTPVTTPTTKQTTLQEAFKIRAIQNTDSNKGKNREELPKRLPLVIANDSDDDTAPFGSASNPSIKPQEKKQQAIKRKKPIYTDYFLEQHNKKKQREENGYDSSSDSDSFLQSAKHHDIFEDYYGTDPPMDWNSLAEKIEYIGKEAPDDQLYCRMKWKDGVRSMHPLSLVRHKRPDLVIDRLLIMLDN